MKGSYYNEFDTKAAAWIRELIKAGHVPDGDVDERSICDVKPDELRGYTQHHFFAGIAGWSYAFKLAGWPADKLVASCSCPCPPFSCAGKKKFCPNCGGKPIPHPLKTGIFACVGCGHEWLADGRHLWPEFFRLARECRFPIVYGEQVGGADGEIWLAGVQACMEGIGYHFGSSNLCAASAGSPQKRQRLYWVALAFSEGQGWAGVESECAARLSKRPRAGRSSPDDGAAITNDSERRPDMAGGNEFDRNPTRRNQGDCESGKCGGIDTVGESDGAGRNAREPASEAIGHGSTIESASSLSIMANPESRGQRADGSAQRKSGHIEQCGEAESVEHAKRERGEAGLSEPEQWDERNPREPFDTGDSVNRRPEAAVAVAQGDGNEPGLEGHAGNVGDGSEPRRFGADTAGSVAEAGAVVSLGDAACDIEQRNRKSSAGIRWDGENRGSGAWSNSRIIQTRDGKSRRIPAQSGVQLLADGVSDPGVDDGWLQGDGTVWPLAQGVKGRVGLLRGFGNAIVPELAAEFIIACDQALKSDLDQP